MLALNIYSSFYSNVTNRGVGQAKAVLDVYKRQGQ